MHYIVVLVMDLFHTLYEVIRFLWPVFFVGWWIFWILRYRRAGGKDRKNCLLIPTITTAIALCVSVVSLAQVYSAVNDPVNFTTSFESCEKRWVNCEQEDRAQAHFHSLAAWSHNGDIAFGRTWWNVFGDTVSLAQIFLLWTGPYLLFLLWALKKLGALSEKPGRDTVHIT